MTKTFRYICPHCAEPIPDPDEVLYNLILEYYDSNLCRITPAELRESLWGDDRSTWPKNHSAATFQYFWKKARAALKADHNLLVDYYAGENFYTIYKDTSR